MAISNGYTTREILKNELGKTASGHDDRIDRSVEAASRRIDSYCGRRFWKDGSDQTRYFTAEWPDLIDLDDIVSITTLKTDDNNDRTYETTWSTSDYDTEPDDGIVDGIAGWPITTLVARTDSASMQRVFPTTKRGIQIVGIFGWNAVPTDVAKACLILAARLFKRGDSPFGTTGSPEVGEMFLRAIDPDVRDLLNPFRKLTVRGV